MLTFSHNIPTSRRKEGRDCPVPLKATRSFSASRARGRTRAACGIPLTPPLRPGP